MKKIIVSMITLGCFILSATAQDKTAMQNHFHHQQEMVIKQLNLTPDQQKQLDVSRANFKTQMIALNKDESMTVKDYRDKKYALRKEQKAAFMAILTPDQKTKLVQIKQDMKAKMDTIATKRLDKMKLELNLSNEQVATIKANRQALRTKIETILQNDSLSRLDLKTQLMAIKKANKDSMKTVLTADQYTKWQELRAARMKKMQDRMQDKMGSGISE
jgi:Spy/CpxP family protein refolding chaperone